MHASLLALDNDQDRDDKQDHDDKESHGCSDDIEPFHWTRLPYPMPLTYNCHSGDIPDDV
jgi:hypothetical protein